MYVGIDPSLINTALVFLEGGKLSYHYIIKTPSTKTWQDGIQRIHTIKRELTFVLYPEVVPYVQCVVMEGYSYGSRFQSHQLGELGYVFRDYLLSLLGGLFFVVPPKTIVKFVTGNGNSKKKDVARKIQTMGIKLPTEHHYDACAAALFAQGIGRQDNLDKSQKAVMERYLGRLK